MIPRKIIDNTDVKLYQFLNDVLNEPSTRQLDIATAFFNIQAYAYVNENLQRLTRFRLLLGKAPEIKNEITFGEVLCNMLKEEIESFELSRDKDRITKEFIDFLKRDNVEVRLYDKDFLHGKAYIFDELVVVGSSNFTPSGLTHNTELNSVSLASEAEYVRKSWFEKFWNEAVDFKVELINLLENSRFGTKEYSPYQVFIKALFELQKDDLKLDTEGKSPELPSPRVNLAEFQEDAVKRAFSRLRKYRACMIADSVGLGKTWIAKRIIEEFGFYRRKKFLVICPAQLREMWKAEIKDLILSESIISQEELASSDFLEKAREAVGGKLEEVSLIVVDESHNFRNPLSNRWENFFTLVAEHIAGKSNQRPYIVFLTATPINNTIWDLYWQIMLMTLNDQKAFLKEGISDIFKFFKNIDKLQDPTLLNDIMNEISIRRTRDYIKKNYPDAEINGQKIVFPKRILENINYHLDEAYQGLYKDISEIITEKLTMAYYRILRYKKSEKLSPEEEMALGRMIALEGIFRTILLKRLESSVEAFRKSLQSHLKFLEKFKEFLGKGKLLTKRSFHKHVLNLDEESEEEFDFELADINLDDYKLEELLDDVERDIELFREMHSKVAPIDGDHDAKLKELKRRLLELSSQGQVVLFTYYADTLDYIFHEITKDTNFSKLKIEKISGRIASAETRSEIVKKFMDGQINILMSTDVLSEGLNLQRAKFLINYDLHWNPTRMIQRAGRIDRIGSPYGEIYVYNFFPEDELEDLLRLVEVLQNKIRQIDNAVGLDQTILGEEVNPKVFGVIRKIREKDERVFEELEEDVFGGGERFYQPLMDYLRTKTVKDLEAIPLGIHSGLRRDIKAIFFYYKYGEDFHLWYLYDMTTGEIITNKTKILNYISCPSDEPRIIPDFFDAVYEINQKIVEEIESSYRELEQRKLVDTSLVETTGDRSKKFISKMIREIDLQIDTHLFDFPEDREIEKLWENSKDKLLKLSLTKKRVKELRSAWRDYRHYHKDWKKLVRQLSDFLENKAFIHSESIEPFDRKKLKLVVIDFIS